MKYKYPSVKIYHSFVCWLIFQRLCRSSCFQVRSNSTLCYKTFFLKSGYKHSEVYIIVGLFVCWIVDDCVSANVPVLMENVYNRHTAFPTHRLTLALIWCCPASSSGFFPCHLPVWPRQSFSYITSWRRWAANWRWRRSQSASSSTGCNKSSHQLPNWWSRFNKNFCYFLHFHELFWLKSNMQDPDFPGKGPGGCDSSSHYCVSRRYDCHLSGDHLPLGDGCRGQRLKPKLQGTWDPRSPQRYAQLPRGLPQWPRGRQQQPRE